jgi:hypothetical protein
MRARQLRRRYGHFARALALGEIVTLPVGFNVDGKRLKWAATARVAHEAHGTPFYGFVWTDPRTGKAHRVWARASEVIA